MSERDYSILENILNKINKQYISLSDEDTSRNNAILKVVDTIIDSIKEENVLFRNLYRNKFYGGSYYDGLKVGKPNEYDLDCCLVLPKVLGPTVEISDKPGFVHITFKDLLMLEKKKDEAPKFIGLTDLLEENRLSTAKVLQWLQSRVDLALNKFTKDDDNSGVTINYGEDDVVKCKTRTNGPAITLKISGSVNEKAFAFDIDFVVCFVFDKKQWPQDPYRKNVSEKFGNFFVVPKCPKKEPLYWRLSFQEQEKELIAGTQLLKPTLRFIKKLNDRYKHNIPSYYIKTVFLWEINSNPSLFERSLSEVLITVGGKMLKRYVSRLNDGKIPYYWNENYNLLSEINKPCTIQQIANTINQKLKEVDRNLMSNPFVIATLFLSEQETEDLRMTVNLGTRHLRRMTSITGAMQQLDLKGSSSSSSSSSTNDLLVNSGNGKELIEESALKLIMDKIGKLDENVSKMTAIVENVAKKQEEDKKLILYQMKILDNKVEKLITLSMGKNDKILEDNLTFLTDMITLTLEIDSIPKLN